MKSLLLFSIFLLTPIAYADTFQCINAAGEIIISDNACHNTEHLDKKENTTLLLRAEQLIKSAKLTIKKYLSAKNNIEPPKSENKNLLKNAAFESSLTSWQVPRDALWSADKGMQNSATLVIHAKLPPDNEYIYETSVKQCVILGAGKKFEFSAQFSTSRAALKPYANRANIIWYESTDCTTDGQWGAYLEPAQQQSGWQKLYKKNLTPALGAKAAMIKIVQNGRYSDGAQAYWDNIHFAATEMTQLSKKTIHRSAYDQFTLALGVNYVSNGEFDNNIGIWRTSWKTEWSESQGDTLPGSAKVTASSESGSIGKGAINQCINFGEHSIFELGASYKNDESSTQSGGGRLRLVWYEELNCHGAAKIDSNWADPENLSGWQRLRITKLIAPSMALSAKVAIIQSISGPGQFSLYWDDIYFIAIQ